MSAEREPYPQSVAGKHGELIFPSAKGMEDQNHNATISSAVSTPVMAVRTSSASLAKPAVNVRWMRLDQLPGLMSAAIREMGAMVFGSLTTTRLGDIEVLAHLNNQGPPTEQDIDFTADRLRRMTAPSGILEYSVAEIRNLFGQPYEAQAIRFEDPESTYFMVKDFMGSYIYKWPSTDTKHPRQNQLPNGT